MAKESGEKTDLESLLYTTIKEHGSKGVLQSELFHKLKIDSKEATKIILRLTKKGLIKKEPVMQNGRRTYRLYAEKRELDINVSLDVLVEIPCFTCKYLNECAPGNRWNPSTCSILDNWLENHS